jgi:hypothetical protein
MSAAAGKGRTVKVTVKKVPPAATGSAAAETTKTTTYTIGGFTGIENAQTAITEAVFGTENLKKLRAANINPRKLYEHTSCDAQCNNVIGAVGKQKGPFGNVIVSSCWICGIPIVYKTDATRSIEPGQCEHVLPIIQAVMFIGLYTGDKKSVVGPENENYRKHLQLEYEWAHEKCNLIKNDDVYLDIEIVGGQEKYTVNQGKIRALLEKVWDDNPDYEYTQEFNTVLRAKYPGARGREAFITARIVSMTRRMRQIADMLNKSNAPGLLKIVAAINLRHNIRAEGAQLMDDESTIFTPKTLKLPTPLSSFNVLINLVSNTINTISGATSKLRKIIDETDAKTRITTAFAAIVGQDLPVTQKPQADCMMDLVQLHYIIALLEGIQRRIREEAAAAAGSAIAERRIAAADAIAALVTSFTAKQAERQAACPGIDITSLLPPTEVAAPVCDTAEPNLVLGELAPAISELEEHDADGAVAAAGVESLLQFARADVSAPDGVTNVEGLIDSFTDTGTEEEVTIAVDDLDGALESFSRLNVLSAAAMRSDDATLTVGRVGRPSRKPGDGGWGDRRPKDPRDAALGASAVNVPLRQNVTLRSLERYGHRVDTADDLRDLKRRGVVDEDELEELIEELHWRSDRRSMMWGPSTVGHPLYSGQTAPARHSSIDKDDGSAYGGAGTGPGRMGGGARHLRRTRRRGGQSRRNRTRKQAHRPRRSTRSRKH